MAIIGVAATCKTGEKAVKGAQKVPGLRAPGHQPRAEGDRPAGSSELEVPELRPNPTPLPARNGLEVDGLLEAANPVTGTTGENFMPESGLNHGSFCAVVIHQDRKTLAHPGQDIFSGKDSGKGDSDFNDSDSDISGDGVRKGSTSSDQKQNGLFPCLRESQPPCSSDPHYNLTSQIAECSKLSSPSKQGYMLYRY
ncbi:hypothetical protein scyTo_0016959 [Scyliorhinus torazame]|uniref:Uncharacterized protein n=1 Tax=Scyliorhinus torazame TaxID=75743 RepID=A0A401Q267_SCYTO|nr:hypothetical protein [Scyliorhinus torazame]